MPPIWFQHITRPTRQKKDSERSREPVGRLPKHTCWRSFVGMQTEAIQRLLDFADAIGSRNEVPLRLQSI